VSKSLTVADIDEMLRGWRAALVRFAVDAPGTKADGDEKLSASRSGIVIEQVNALENGFKHRWPDKSVGTAYRPIPEIPTAAYEVRDSRGLWTLVLGAEEGGRRSHGRDGRGRIVVFVDHNPGKLHLYPLVEFAETDDAGTDGKPRYGAGVPRPDAPRSLATLAHVDQLREVVHLQDAELAQAEDVYRDVQRGPSLRLVVPVNDVETMLAHALWVGHLRGSNRLPRPRP
jgi:hypothetical protein